MSVRKIMLVAALLGIAAAARGQSPGSDAPAAAPLEWPAVTGTMRPWAYWWWMGSAVDAGNLARELSRYHDAGLGGVHVIPIYGARGFENRFIDYLSPKWVEMLRTAIAQARGLGMGVDMTTGSGWCFGGPNVTAHDAAAQVVVKTFDVPAGGQLREKFSPAETQALAAYAADGRCLDLTARIDDRGAVDWTAPPGTWKVYALAQHPSSLHVKRAAPGGQGYMLNPLYPPAIRHYLPRFSDALGGVSPRAMYHDSYEYVSDWAPDLLEQFQRRRGYRLQEHLPELFARDGDERVARVKGDYRETLSDVMIEQFLPAWVEWAHARGVLTRNQAHGSPGNLLDLYAAADIPETEMFNKDRDPLVSKFASSAAHTGRHNLVAAETGTWLAEHFTETLGDLKLLVDELFVSGINHVFYHGTCYSPDEAGWPGWHFYAATEMNPRNAIWHDVPALNAYIARCQSILQSGRPDNEILLYWPIHDFWHNPRGLVQQLTVHATDWLHGQPVGAAAEWLWRQGYTFDYLSDRRLAACAAQEGAVRVSGLCYSVVVVPAAEHVPVETMNRLIALADDGATVIFQGHLPSDVPGWARLDERRAALGALRDRVLRASAKGAAGRAADGRATTVSQAKLGRGRVLIGDLQEALALAGVAREKLVDVLGPLFVRRAAPGQRDYLIVHRGREPIDGWIPLATKARSVALMDPLSGRLGSAAVRNDAAGNVAVYLQLQPNESIILRALARRSIAGPPWTYLRPRGQPVAIGGAWQVKFVDGGPVLPAAYGVTRLASWTARGDAEAERFAGTARYTIAFDAPAAPADAWLLDLGSVCHSARVRLNGRELGTLFMAPYRLRVDRLQPRGNRLEVEVTNLSANRIRDLDRRHVPWRTFYDINFVGINYRPFDASGWPVRDSGLLGPVQLRPAATWPVTSAGR